MCFGLTTEELFPGGCPLNRFSIKNLNNKRLELIDILHLYRYSTLIVISVFFLVGTKINSISKNIIVIGCIGISAILLNYFYKHFSTNNKVVISLLLMETVFNAFILIPLGGLNSPFIWYSLNTIVIASVLLRSSVFCWVNLLIYLFCSTYVISEVLNPTEGFINILQKESNLILSLVLITGIIQILIIYYNKVQLKKRELEEVNKKIISANKKIKESVDYIMELYQAVHLMTTQQDKENLMNTILEYTKKITKSETVFCIRNYKGQSKIALYPKDNTGQVKRIIEKLYEYVVNISSIKETTRLTVDGRVFVLVPIMCQCEVYGFLGAEDNAAISETVDLDVKEQLKFLSELGTISLEKFELEEINKGLLINEEQNRIANEIHDGVLQKLFVISCAIFGLKKKAGNLDTKVIESELELIQASINKAMGDLRSTIYGYSWKKHGANNFVEDIKNLINSIEKYHGVDIEFELEGNQELLTTDHKKAFYRIVSESTANALRHGRSSHISVSINILVDEALLQIKDDGEGFNLNIMKETSKQGMGIRNIKTLAASLNGSCQILSDTGKGTVLNIKVPLKLRSCKEDLYESVGC